MNHNDTRGTVTEVVEIKRDVLTSNTSRRNVERTFTSGGIFSDFELAWLYSGPYLKVVNVSDGAVQSSWDFSLVTRDSKTEITGVIEYEISDHGNRLHSKESQFCLIVSYSSNKDSNKSSYISFCHPRTSKILHTVTTKEKITCMSVITSKKDHSCPISGIVKLMSGALALGTKNGNLLIMDIKGYDIMNEVFSSSRKTNISDLLQNRFSCMMILNIKQFSETEIKDKICKVDEDNYHVTVSLPVTERRDARDCDLFINSMMYIPEGLTLAVGFRSGSFQLWDICSLKKLFKSSSLSVPTPVVRFGFQEPCNDPQNFCYLWVLHESGGEDDNCLPFAVMYGILYKKVASTPEYGRYYKNFVHCKKRFDMDVDMERSMNGRCITCSVVSNTPSNMLRHITVNEEDPSKINLFVMVFETWENTTDLSSHISLVVFDMNQWYKAQMPHQCYHGYSVPFVNFILLDRVSERKSSILDMRIRKDTIQQFLTFNLSEEYSYPSSLSFDTIFLTNVKMINLRIPGVQRCIIEQIVAEGPNCLVNPSKYFTECKDAGLRPSFSDNYGQVVLSQIQQRNYILTILLEHKMSSFLVRCVKEWADGSRAVSGCTLPNLIHWAWDCVTRIKQLTDTICVPLFDYSGDDLDRENYQKLKHCSQLLKLIRDLLMYILKNFKQYLLDSKKLFYQVETLQLVTKYFDVIIWCLDVGLLPEKVISTSDRCIPTYMVSLMQYSEQRREELKKVAMKDKYFSTENTSLYIIDSILEKEAGGKALREQWERESCGMTNGLYPPVTLQSLLRMFLMPNLSNDTKHFIIMYFLLDVCDYHRDEDMKEQLLSFAVIFFTESKFLSLVETCWLIDHEKFEEASDLLLTDAVIGFLKNNKNLCETILKSCVCQEQYAIALKCERVIKISNIFNDESFHITLLLLNGLVMEAYSDLRKKGFVDRKLLQNFFKVCDELGYLKEVFKFPLLPEEEQEFLLYLDNSSNKDAGDLKIMYLLSRGRYVEAVDINYNLSTKLPKYGIIGNDTTKQNNNGRTTTRDLLVNAFSKTLPNVTNELINFCRKERDKLYRHKHIDKPTPMSVVVHVDTDKQVPVYKSSFESVMQAAICKTAETWSNFPKIDKFNKNVSFVQNTPFLRSEMMTPKRKHCSNISFSNSIKNKPKLEQKDPDEPPTKKIRRSSNNLSLNVTVANDESLLSAPLEVTTILRTPHIQKRLNKLLQNTPETSPLTSILKSSEMSRFKQPQKVGFSVPEKHKRTPQRKTADVGTMISTPIAEGQSNLENSTAKKSLAKDFERSSVEEQEETELRNENITPTKESSSTIESPQSGSKDDSYYSLESVHDNENRLSFMLDESTAKENANVHRSTTTFIELMSEESSANATPVQSPQQLPKVPSTLVTTELQASMVTEIEPMEIGTFNHDTIKSLDEENNKLEEGNAVYSNYEEIYADEEKTFENVYATESCNERSGQENVHVDEPNEEAGSNIDKTSEYESEEDKEYGSESEEISDEEDKCQDEDDVETEEDKYQEEAEEEETCNNERPSSVTEVLDSSEEDSDSDIEIIEDNAPTPQLARITPLYRNEECVRAEGQLDNDDELSEKTYESDYTYSDESLGEESEREVAEQDARQEDDNVYVDDSNDVEYDEEDEKEYEDDANEEKEIDVNEHDASAINYDELKNIVMTITAAENKAQEAAAAETVDEIAQAENEGNTIYESILLDASTVDDSVAANASTSVCELYDATASVVETTVNLSAFDTKESTANESVEIISQTIDSNCSLVESSLRTDTENDTKADNTENNTASEPSLVFYFGENSVTSIGEDILTEERNTSESKSKDVAVAESEVVEQKQFDVKNTTEASSSSEDQPMEVDENKQEGYACAGEAKQFCMVEKNADETYSSAKEHDFLRTSVPECNIHIIEKVRNEMYSSDDGYDDSDVLIDQISDDNQEANVTYNVEQAQVADRVDDENQKAAVNVVIVENLTPKYEGEEAENNEKDDIVLSPCSATSSQTCVTVVEADKSQHMSSFISEGEVSVDVSVVHTLPTGEKSTAEAKIISDENNAEELTSEVNIINEPEAPPTSREETKAEEPLQNESFEVKYDSPVVAIKRSDSSTLSHHEAKSTENKSTNDEPIQSISPGAEPSTPEKPVDQVEPRIDPEPITTPSTPRRSIRIAKRRSIDCIPATDLDDTLSIKSGSSVSGSVTSRVSVTSASSAKSNQSQRKKSLSRLELRKSTQKYPFKQLEVIVSDEETSSPKNAQSQSYPMYAVSEPGQTRQSTNKRKRSARSELAASEDDDRLSSISETGDAKTVHKRNVRRKSNLFQRNDENVEVTPESVANKRLGKFVSSTPLVLNKAKEKPSQEAAAKIEQYASTRRLTRSQKMYMEYGFMNRGDNNPQMNLPSSSGMHRAPNVEKLDNIEESECEYSLSIDDRPDKLNSPMKPTSESPTDPQTIKPISSRLRTPKKDQPSLPSRFSKRLSGRFESQTNEDSLSSEEPPSPAKSVSSVAESTSSRASTASKRSTRGRRSYTSMELRKSSVRPNFKPLAVIPSDDESFQQPTPTKTAADDSFHSSAESTYSRASMESRRSLRNAPKSSDEVSDVESSVSNSSNVTASSVGSRKRTVTVKRVVRNVKKKVPEDASSELPTTVTTRDSDRRFTRNQKIKVQKTLKPTSRKKDK